MRNRFIPLVSIALLIALTSCGLKEMPVDLLRSPLIPDQQTALRKAVLDGLPPGAKLTLPNYAPIANAIHEVDLDGDGINEAIAFYKVEKNEFELGVLIFARTSEGWVKQGELRDVGQSFHYVEFQDVTGDHIADLLVGYNGFSQLDRNLSVYNWKKMDRDAISKLPYQEVIASDMDNDGVSDLVLLQLNRNDMVSTAQLFKVINNNLTEVNALELDGTINNFTNVFSATTAVNVKGIIVEAAIGEHAAASTLLIKKDGRLVNALAKKEAAGIRKYVYHPYPTTNEDINGDGIIELGQLRQPPGYENYTIEEMPWIHVWSKWNGKTDLTVVLENILDYDLGFRLDIPPKWKTLYTFAKEQNLEQETGSYTFFYTYKMPTTPKIPLMEIRYFPIGHDRIDVMRWKEEKQFYVLLGEHRGKVFYGLPSPEFKGLKGSDKTQYDAMRMNITTIPEQFRFIPVIPSRR